MLQEVAELRFSGHSIREIASKTGASPTKVHRIVSELAICGQSCERRLSVGEKKAAIAEANAGGRSIREIAEETGIPPTTVHRLLDVKHERALPMVPVRDICLLRQSGMSIRGIAKATGISPTNVHYHLKKSSK